MLLHNWPCPKNVLEKSLKSAGSKTELKGVSIPFQQDVANHNLLCSACPIKIDSSSFNCPVIAEPAAADDEFTLFTLNFQTVLISLSFCQCIALVAAIQCWPAGTLNNLNNTSVCWIPQNTTRGCTC
jgi:hypothetical protein